MPLKIRHLAAVLFTLTSLTAYASPEEWTGTWVGTCISDNYNTDNATTPYDIKVNIAVNNSQTLDWSIQYPPEAARKYQLKLQNDLAGHYILDEKNGILIDQFYGAAHLRELYVVNGKIFTGSTTKSGDVLTMEHTSYWANPLHQTSLPDGSFPVSSYALRDHTICKLSKKPAN
jgi:hypothetical protein